MSRKNLDRETIRSMYEDRMMPMEKLAKELGIGENQLRKKMREFSIPARKPGHKKGSSAHAWRGGTTTDKSGYILRYSPSHPAANVSGYVREHRLVAEKMLGRYLLPGEVVHHIDDDRSNNAPSNLQVFQSNGHHLAATLKGKCPKWSEDGRRRILKAISKPRVSHLVDWEKAVESYRSGLSLLEVGSAFSVCGETIRRGLEKRGVEIRSCAQPQSPKWPSDEKLHEMYQSMTMPEIAAAVGMAESSVHRKLHQIGVQTRPRGKVFHARPAKRHERKSTSRQPRQRGD